jgi:hypothetical protein
MCQTCRHYEPAATWKRGWCRNPRLYGPQESHLVDQESLDCSRGLGSFWEPADPSRPTTRTPPLPAVSLSPLAVDPGSVNAGIGQTPSAPTPSSSFAPERAVPRPQEERPVSYQPEERYWTDYLRIALPVAGLLILIGLLWWWASALIGGPGDVPTPTQVVVAELPPAAATPPPTATAAAAVEPVPGAPDATTAPAAAPTTAPAVAATTPVPTTAPAAPVATQPPAAEPTAAPAEAAADSANPCANLPLYPVGTALVTTEAVNLRDGPNATDALIVVEMPAGTQLTTTGEVFEAGQCDWWPVTVDATGAAGWVFEQFVRAAS